jgi:hypothetical protein
MRATADSPKTTPRPHRAREGLRRHGRPGRVFDRTANLDGVPDGYRAMHEREALKVLIEP